MRVKKNLLKYKDPNTGKYVPIPAVVGDGGSEGVYELIEVITVDEESVRRIDRTAEPNGQTYNFKKVYILCLTSKAYSSGSIYILANGIEIAIMNNIIREEDTGGIGQVSIEVENGIVSGWGASTKNLQTSAPLQKYILEKNIPTNEKSISTIRIMSTADIPVGTNIRIWGVRA